MKNSNPEGRPKIIRFPGDIGESGSLFFWENKKLFPDGIRRCFWVHKVPEGFVRGKHAHRNETQILIAMSGILEVKIQYPDGEIETFILNEPSEGLLIPPLHWVETKFSPDAVLLGLSDRDFSEDDYIRDPEEFGNS
ncbi:sugar 3,4-ketoisomerase [Algoriphagus limi]|uniref:FdtA/QdtA family cupin domain-containing protein n=1 Tax=Algoriphagus limi TaxID=2975273 RepID=A0ABT2G5R3_9BACT|nr:FdtA/QdtA family cupin domain-containing protein [Algoriphagus limi]MCS5490118.1 FdtA/QdtA family cupin domain-containing protein [Algoriphagus limi]